MFTAAISMVNSRDKSVKRVIHDSRVDQAKTENTVEKLRKKSNAYLFKLLDTFA